jgi:HTH-type transcriptional regulator / antitoxin HipB
MAQPRRRTSAIQASGLRRAVAERRLTLGLTQYELADLADVSRAALQRLETGAPSARLETLESVAVALGCRVALIDATGSVVRATDDD